MASSRNLWPLTFCALIPALLIAQPEWKLRAWLLTEEATHLAELGQHRKALGLFQQAFELDALTRTHCYDAVSCALAPTKTVRERPVNWAARKNSAFCCSVMRASSRAVFSDERSRVLDGDMISCAPLTSSFMSVRPFAVHVKYMDHKSHGVRVIQCKAPRRNERT